MESTLDIRKKIHEFIDHADDRILKIINAIILTEEETDKMKPQSFYEELDKRKEKYLKGESKSYTWEEVKTNARA
jgi:hypothetical protein